MTGPTVTFPTRHLHLFAVIDDAASRSEALLIGENKHSVLDEPPGTRNTGVVPTRTSAHRDGMTASTGISADSPTPRGGEFHVELMFSRRTHISCYKPAISLQDHHPPCLTRSRVSLASRRASNLSSSAHRLGATAQKPLQSDCVSACLGPEALSYGQLLRDSLFRNHTMTRPHCALR